MRACQCEAAAAAEGGTGTAVASHAGSVNIEPCVDGKGTEVGTEWEASINFYREALSFESEKFFEPGNRSVQTLSYSSPLRRGEGAEGVAEMEMRLRYHPATCEGVLVSVGVPSLKTCSVGHLSCVVHSRTRDYHDSNRKNEGQDCRRLHCVMCHSLDALPLVPHHKRQAEEKQEDVKPAMYYTVNECALL